MNIFPYGYTSHGGERWDIHGDETLVPDFWRQSIVATSERDTVHQIKDFALANVEETKGYLEDVLSDMNVRAVRPSGLSNNRPSIDAVHDWREEPKLFGLYRDKMNFATTHFTDAPATADFLEQQAGYLQSHLGDDARLVGDGCLNAGCDISHVSLLPAPHHSIFHRG